MLAVATSSLTIARKRRTNDGVNMKRQLMRKVAMSSAVAALALGAVGCDAENGDADPGLEGEDDLGGEGDL